MWSRGLSKVAARSDYWTKAITPSTELRHWYGHDPEKWSEFKQRYFPELDSNREAIEELRMNNAVALIEYLQRLNYLYTHDAPVSQ